jgi:dolichol kinase
MAAACATENRLEQMLAALAGDLRTFIANMQRLRSPDAAWLAAARRRSQELAERIHLLGGQLQARRQAVPGALAEMRSTLATLAGELGGRVNGERLQQLGAALSRRYEDLLVQLRQLGLWRREVARRIRSLRLPSWSRSAFHAAMGVTGVALYQFVLDRATTLWILAGLLGLFAGLDIARRFSPRFNDLMIDRLFGAIVRPQERYRIPSASWYLLALAVVVLVAPAPVACAAVLVLALADPAASLVGSRWGSTKLVGDKSLQGSLAFLAAGLLAAGGYLLAAGPWPAPQALLLAAAMAATGTLVELFSDRLDDNFSVPVACALCGLLLV